MNDDDDARLGGLGEGKSSSAAVAARALAFDPERYRHHVAHLDMSEEAQIELLAVVHRIMESFVDRAFGHDAAQLARIAGDSRDCLRDREARSGVSSDHPAHVGDESLADVFRLSGGEDQEGAARP
jgi:hypothetical protein